MTGMLKLLTRCYAVLICPPPQMDSTPERQGVRQGNRDSRQDLQLSGSRLIAPRGPVLLHCRLRSHTFVHRLRCKATVADDGPRLAGRLPILPGRLLFELASRALPIAGRVRVRARLLG
jgi:hypothetical protein